MKAEIKQKLIDVLESGEYKQIHGKLRHDDCFCAMGVLTDLFHKETGKGEWRRQENGQYTFVIGDEECYCYTPAEVEQWTEYESINELDELFMMNDHEKLTFKQIAERLKV